ERQSHERWRAEMRGDRVRVLRRVTATQSALQSAQELDRAWSFGGARQALAVRPGAVSGL
ncbi:MAG: hypothetical protein AAGF51_13830, partial [Pseudomonadota bacterium]